MESFNNVHDEYMRKNQDVNADNNLDEEKLKEKPKVEEIKKRRK